MRFRAAELENALQFHPSARFGTREYWNTLRRAFGESYPTSVTPRMKGQQRPTGLVRRTELALARNGLRSVGAFEIVTEDELMKDRLFGKPTGLGKATLDEVKAFLSGNERQLREPSVPHVRAARSAFGKPDRVPTSWLIFDEALTLDQYQSSLESWGVNCLGDLCRVPQSTLLLLSDENQTFVLGPANLERMQRSLAKMNQELRIG